MCSANDSEDLNVTILVVEAEHKRIGCDTLILDIALAALIDKDVTFAFKPLLSNMKLLALSLLLVECLAHPTRRQDTSATTPNITDVDILQYALTLEHLGSHISSSYLT